MTINITGMTAQVQVMVIKNDRVSLPSTKKFLFLYIIRGIINMWLIFTYKQFKNMLAVWSHW
jgi:hypothetical protein